MRLQHELGWPEDRVLGLDISDFEEWAAYFDILDERAAMLAGATKKGAGSGVNRTGKRRTKKPRMK